MKEKFRIEIEDYVGNPTLCEHFDNFPDAESFYESRKNMHPDKIITFSKILVEKTRHTELRHKL